MLSSSPDLEPFSEMAEPLTVGVGPVSLPDYLMRPEIVCRPGASEIALAEFDRWAEPLDETVARVLLDNLSRVLPDAGLLSYPYNRTTPVDLRLEVDVKSFEQQPDGAVLLAAAWSLFDREGKMLRKEETRITAGVSGEGYPAVVSAMNAALAELSEKLAQALSVRMP
jgi:uncharacterized lipoprotein YmbA